MLGRLFIVISVLTSGLALADSTWKCVSTTGHEISVIESGQSVYVCLAQDLKTKKGTIPAGNHAAKLSAFQYVGIKKMWVMDASKFILDYDEDYHRYRNATLAVALSDKEPNQGFLFIEQIDWDPDLSGIVHLNEILACNKP